MTTQTETTPSAPAKKVPIPVRLDQAEDISARQIARETGLTLSEVLRRACRFALPKFESGEVDIIRDMPPQN